MYTMQYRGKVTETAYGWVALQTQLAAPLTAFNFTVFHDGCLTCEVSIPHTGSCSACKSSNSHNHMLNNPQFIFRRSLLRVLRWKSRASRTIQFPSFLHVDTRRDQAKELSLKLPGTAHPSAAASRWAAGASSVGALDVVPQSSSSSFFSLQREVFCYKVQSDSYVFKPMAWVSDQWINGNWSFS